ncbi:hypothetical protein P691DRAFT_691072 [Macrolepiota fuliginosa MF-IS2]|uniref:Mid2 domain-containing protein n=1 Tax=Macrolepiota fuliginosa MF-IS2 TaxID=1400762 RepID=A0A9P6C7B0_9AGAR|nr:hypothetical protein P691DRAFT_691072 [Macrolepiota fuliginosa MF-IS2]
MYSLWTFSLLFLSFHFPVYSQTLVNVTVDDTVPNPATNARVTYLDAGWSQCPTMFCPSPRPDPSEALNETWRTSIFDPTQGSNTNLSISPPRASITFFGSAVYVYCILSLSESSDSTTNSDMLFKIDEEEPGFFSLESQGATSGGSAFAYNVLVYANSSLLMDNHTLTIQNGRGPGGTKALMMLDYVVFSTNPKMISEPPPPAVGATSQSPDMFKSKILTGVLVTVCLLFGIVLAYLLRGFWTTKIRWPRPRTATEVLPISTQQTRQPFVWRWLGRCLGFRSINRGVPFNPSLFVANRPQSQSESMKDLALPQLHGQRQSEAISLEDELETQSKKSATEGRWAFITSWRDRTVQEAEIPSLPPTSNAPTTILSDLTPQVRPLQSHRPQQQEETPGTQPRRGFTIMNT